MAAWCVASRALSSGGGLGLGVYARKHTGRYLCAALLSGVPAAAVTRVRRCEYSSDTAHVPGQFVCHHLSHRSLLKVRGPDTSPFLQGIITNDMTLLEEPGAGAMYAHMLRVDGRTLYDVLLYRLKEADAGFGIFLECDAVAKDLVLRHMKMYKIRREVKISPCPDLSVWAVLPQQKNPGREAGEPELTSPENALVWEADPRIKEMGWRLVLDSKTDPCDVIASCEKGDTEDYHRHRYTIGLPEGPKDLPPGIALPLEANLVYMQGISFSKGCYIGQELTARTHHTGVIRKRLMPVRLSSPAQDLEEGAAVQTLNGKPAGKHRSGVGVLGLSVIRIAHAKEVLKIRSPHENTVTLTASVPDWWPEDAKNI